MTPILLEGNLPSLLTDDYVLRLATAGSIGVVIEFCGLTERRPPLVTLAAFGNDVTRARAEFGRLCAHVMGQAAPPLTAPLVRWGHLPSYPVEPEEDIDPTDGTLRERTIRRLTSERDEAVGLLKRLRKAMSFQQRAAFTVEIESFLSRLDAEKEPTP